MEIAITTKGVVFVGFAGAIVSLCVFLAYTVIVNSEDKGVGRIFSTFMIFLSIGFCALLYGCMFKGWRHDSRIPRENPCKTQKIEKSEKPAANLNKTQKTKEEKQQGVE